MQRTITFTLRINVEHDGPQELMTTMLPWLVSTGRYATNLTQPVVEAHPAPHPEQVPPSRTFLSTTPCRHGHVDAMGKTERYARSNMCTRCAKEHPPRRRTRSAPSAERNGHQADTMSSRQAERPELPSHLRDNSFLSPITCADLTHRYRNMPEWTLRYQTDERCVMCVTTGAVLVSA